ncbi:MAG: hypothetical protein O2818_02470 [Bacteroidetes bacterium]|nr:hypothetical protein [Bacteroidota bacterium]MDA1335730.1 hypothetical protein [Bacteroidota bacterium]
MSIPLNPHAVQYVPSIQNLAEAQKWIDGFPRPLQFNPHAWQTTKKLALLVWKCYLERRPFHRTLNFLHPDFYEMIRTPEGISLVEEGRLRKF